MTLEQFIIRILESDVSTILLIMLYVLATIAIAMMIGTIFTAIRERKDGKMLNVYYTYDAAKEIFEEDGVATQEELLRWTKLLGKRGICRRYGLRCIRKWGTGICRFCLPEEKKKDTSETDIFIGSYEKNGVIFES